MTRSTMQTPTPEPVDLDAESPSTTDRSRAARLAQATACGVARGAGSVAKGGGRVLGQGYAAAKSELERRRAVPVTVQAEDVASARTGRGLRPILLIGAAVTAVAAGVAVWQLRRPQPAPVADRPPSLRDLEVPEQAT